MARIAHQLSIGQLGAHRDDSFCLGGNLVNLYRGYPLWGNTITAFPGWQGRTSPLFGSAYGLIRFFFSLISGALLGNQLRIRLFDLPPLQVIDRLHQLEIVLTPKFEHLGLFDVFPLVLSLKAAIFIMQVTFEITLARDTEQISLGSIIDVDVWLYPGHLYGAPLGGIVQGGGQLDARLIVERQNALYRPLAKTAVANHGRSPMILQGAGHNL